MKKRILFISNYKRGIGGISGQVEVLTRCLANEDGYETYIFSTKGNPLRRIGIFFRLLFEARKYDVLHIHPCSGWGMLPAVYGVIAGKLWHKRIIMTYHGGGAADYFEKHGGFARRWLCRADQVIVLNGYLEKIFAQYKIPCVVIPNVIELRQDIYTKKSELKPRLISIRTLSATYRIDLILKAYEQILTPYPDATLDVLSDGEMRAKLEQYVSDRHLKGVRFVGQVPNEKIYDYLRKNDILLSAPVVDNMPVSVLEAMNAGLLVVSSRVGGVPYIIEEGRSGLLFESGNAGQMAEKIEWALAHQEESIKMIEQAHEDVQRYTWSEVRTKILPLYA